MFKKNIFLVFFLAMFLSCDCPKKLDVVHLSFYDNPNVFFVAGDTAKLKHLSHLTIYFLARGSHYDCIKIKELQDFLDSSKIVISQKKLYYSVRVVFFKSSTNANRLLEEQRVELVTYCNDDVVAEFEYKKGQFLRYYRYSNGIIVDDN